jgi:putative ABC transport system substrate-binding protein
MRTLKRRSFVAGLGSIACPFVATAREAAKVPLIGVLWHSGSPDEEQPFFSALLKGFNDLGYVEGQNIHLEHRFPNELPDRFRSMLAELLALNVDVLVSITPASYYAKGATGTVPHVFVMVPDPVGDHFVASLAHPGGNETGLSLLSTDLTRKRVQLLREAIPELSLAGLLVNPNIPVTPMIVKEARTAADEIGLSLRVFEAPSVAELESAFDAMSQAGVQGVVVGAAGLFYQGKAFLAKLASTHHLPINVWARELMLPGVFMCYGPSMAGIVRRAPIYVDRIIKGAKPSELPVEQPTRLNLIIDLTVAKTLGIDVPAALIGRADEVIE